MRNYKRRKDANSKAIMAEWKRQGFVVGESIWEPDEPADLIVWYGNCYRLVEFKNRDGRNTATDQQLGLPELDVCYDSSDVQRLLKEWSNEHPDTRRACRGNALR